MDGASVRAVKKNEKLLTGGKYRDHKFTARTYQPLRRRRWITLVTLTFTWSPAFVFGTKDHKALYTGYAFSAPARSL
jgi:hypothetical protein